MLGGWFAQGRGPIGLDLGSQSVRLLQLRRAGTGLAAAAAASWELPGDLPAQGPERREALVRAIGRMLETGGFRGRRVVSCLPAAAVQYKNLRLPPMPPDELRAAVEWEAADRLRLDKAQTLVQCFDAGEVRQGDELRQEVILMAVPLALVEEHLAVLRRCNLTPTAIDAAPGALARALPGEPAAPAGTGAGGATDGASQVLLDVGYLSSKVLIARQGRVLFFKLIDLGGRQFDQAVADRLNLPPMEAAQMRRKLHAAGENQEPLFGSSRRENVQRAVSEALRGVAGELAREVGLCLRYYSVTFRGRRPDTALLAGGEAYEPQLLKVLADEAALTAAAAQPLAGMDLGRIEELTGGAPTLSEWTVAAGLARRGLTPSAPAPSRPVAAADVAAREVAA